MICRVIKQLEQVRYLEAAKDILCKTFIDMDMLISRLRGEGRGIQPEGD